MMPESSECPGCVSDVFHVVADLGYFTPPISVRWCALAIEKPLRSRFVPCLSLLAFACDKECSTGGEPWNACVPGVSSSYMLGALFRSFAFTDH